MSDSVNKPAHYNAGEVETIDGIKAALGEGFADYCKGNVIKYVWRCGKKGDAVEDLRKARKYLEWAIEAMEGNCPVMPDSSDRKPLAIPSGWRELEENEPLCEDDLFELDGEWVGHEYDPSGGVYSSRIHRQHIRKIETDEPKPIAIPDGWRELEPDEFPRVTDMYENEGAWRKRINDSSIEYARYEARHIRKIEPANTSETPNSSTPAEWVPKVGDRVKVVGNDPKLCGDRAVVYEVNSCSLSARVVSYDGRREGWLRFEDLELIEAAP